MSEEITQQLGIDASAALDALKALDSAFQSFEQRLKSVASTASGLNAAFSKINPAALATGLNSTASAASAVDSSFKTATRSTDGFGVSLETVTRVITTQAIVRGLSAIRNATEDSFQGFIDFQRAAAEVQTIAGNTSIEDLSKQIADFAVSFNVPLLTAAKAQYQTLSNGFTQAADAQNVMTAAAKLAKVGLSTETQAVDTLSSALNAYGKNASEAGNLSGKLIQSTIDGRQTIEQMSSAIGRVVPLAAQLGVSFEEVLASLSSLTQGGVSASEATTQLRSALSAFIKPSDAMLDAFHRLGVATGEQLIASKGLAGAYSAVISTTDGTSLAIGKLFANQRGLTGVLRENGAAADVYTQHLANARAASEELQNTKFTLRVGSDTAQLDAAINQLKVFFVSDIGKLLTGTASKAVQTIGTDNLIAGISALVPVMGAATVAVTAYATIATTARLRSDLLATSTNGLSLSMGTLRGGLIGLTTAFAAYEAGTAIGSALTHVIEADRDAALKAQAQLLESQRNAVANAAQVEAAGDAKSLQLINDRFLEIRRGYDQQVAEAKASNDELLTTDKTLLDKIISGHERFSVDLKRIAQQAQTDSTNAVKQANTLQGQLLDQRFTFALSRTSEFNQALQAAQRAQSLASQGAGQLGSAHTPADQAIGQNTLQRAEQFAQMAANIAKATGNLGLQVQAEQTLESITAIRINAENTLAANRARDAQIASKADAEEKSRVTKLQQLAKDYLSNASAFDKQGNPLAPDQLTANFAKAKQSLAEFQRLAFQGKAVDASTLFSFDQLSARLDQSLTPTELKQLKAAPSALDDLFKQIQGSADKHAIALSFATDPSKLKGNLGEVLNGVQQQLASGGTNLAGQRAASTANANSQNAIDSARTEAARSFSEAATGFEQSVIVLKTFLSTATGHSPESQQLNAQVLGSVRQQIQTAIASPNVQASEVNRLSDALTELQRNGPSSLATVISRANNELNQLVAVFNEEQSQLTRAAQGLNPQALTTAVDQLEQNIERASSAFGNKFIDSGVFQPANRAAGGRIDFLASGGLARGTDTVPAMLSPGETVINAGSSRKFFSQLQAIQAGVQPIYRESGGPVTTNNTVGDVSINIKSNDPKLSGDAVVSALKRTFRTGTSRLK